ncbi:MAG: DsbA family protein [Alphaproteobacteria bacterium]|nr:DsbA family protein [Alphaproteobacteria bacterium]
MLQRFFAFLPLFALLLIQPASASEMEGLKDNVAKKEAVGDVVKTGDILVDHVLGNATAPVTIIEYASLTCGHCAHFHKEILPEVIKKYVATGKVKILFRDFPLNALALKAAQLSQCMPEDRYFPFIKTVFENLEGWTSSADPEATLAQYAKLAGLPGERVTSCLNDKNLQDAIVKRRMQGENQFKIGATPTFVVNYGQGTITDITTFEEFDAALKKYVK